MTPGLHTTLELALLAGWDWGLGRTSIRGETRIVVVAPGSSAMYHVLDSPMGRERLLLLMVEKRERAR